MISKLGFKKGRILECIIATYNADGSPNAAPMGVRALDGRDVLMKVSTDTRTHANILRNKCCVINISFDPLLFLKTVVKAGKLKVKGSEVRKSKVNAPFLKNAHVFFEAHLKEHRKHKKSTFSAMKFRVIRTKILKKYPFGISRGLYAALEAAIALSRGAGVEEKHMDTMKRTLSRNEYKRISKFLEQLK